MLAFLAGAFGALALAPLNVGPALIVTLVAAVWLLDAVALEPLSAPARARHLRSAFGAGWWLGFGYFTAGLWWLGAAFVADPEFLWALPFGVIGVPAALALFPACGFALAWVFWRPNATRILALVLGLSLAEWGRGHLLTGFPWNPWAMGLAGNIVTAQAASLVGLDGLTLLTVVLFAAPATLADAAPARRARLLPTALAAAGICAIAAFGAVRLASGATRDIPGAVVRIMQPGPLPNSDFVPENKDAIVSHYLALSERYDGAKGIGLADVTMLVWPESAFPFILTRDAEELARIGRTLPPHTTLVTGAARENDVAAFGAEPERIDYYNDIEVIASGGKLIGSYDKIHLVPFGEYLPFGPLLSRLGLRNFVAIPGGFEFGHERRPLSVPGMPPASPSICYEAIFPGEVMADGSGSGERPGFLLNVTNDGWFGLTSGPSQHFAQARLRTIEEGLPLVRGAATGISAVVDPYGRVVASLPLGAEGILDAKLPRPIDRPFFTWAGDWPFAFACAAIACLLSTTNRPTLT